MKDMKNTFIRALHGELNNKIYWKLTWKRSEPVFFYKFGYRACAFFESTIRFWSKVNPDWSMSL